mgnify:FL=1
MTTAQTPALQVPQSTIQWTLASALKAYQSRQKFTKEQSANGQRVILRLTGNGNIIDVIDGQGNHVVSTSTGEALTKKIFNTNATNPYSLETPRVKELQTLAMKAEKEGRVQDAANYFNAWLNATTLSFSVLSNTREYQDLGKGDEITCNLLTVTTDNGSLTTVDPKGIKINAGVRGTTATDNPFTMETSEDDSNEEPIIPSRAELVAQAKVLKIKTKDIPDAELFALITAATVAVDEEE